MVVSDLSLVRLNSSQVNSHQAVEAATVSRPAEKRFSVHEKTGLEIVEMRGERQHNAIIYPLTCHIYPLSCLGSPDFTVYY